MEGVRGMRGGAESAVGKRPKLNSAGSAPATDTRRKQLDVDPIELA